MGGFPAGFLMTNVAPEEGRQGEANHAHRVAEDFNRVYYHVLNDNPEYLHQFYGVSSTLTVSETQDDGSNFTVRADNLELIKALTLRMFADVRVSLTNCTPQTSLGGSIQLMVSGVMHQKNCDEERLFTQAMLLAKQDQGYYVLNDTVHVHSRSSSWKVLNFERTEEGALVQKQTETEAEATPQQDMQILETAEETHETEETVQPPEDVQVVETVPVAETESSSEVTAAAPQGHGFEDEPVGPPTSQKVTPIEKPAPVQPTAQPPPSSAPGSSARRSYKDVALNTKRQAPMAQAK